MGAVQALPKLSQAELRQEIKKEYANVARDPNRGYHFHTGRRLAALLGYDESLYADLPEPNVASFAGTGNPFMLGSVLRARVQFAQVGHQDPLRSPPPRARELIRPP